MSYQFLFEDGAGNFVDENGNDPMDIESEDPFKLEDLASYKLYIEVRSKTCEVLTNEDITVQNSIEVNQATAESVKIYPRKAKPNLVVVTK